MTDRVFHAIRGLSIDGVGTLFLTRIKALARYGWRQQLFVFNPSTVDPASRAHLQTCNTDLLEGDYSPTSRRSLIQSTLECAKAIRRFSPTVVHTWGVYPLVAARLAVPSGRVPVLADWVTTDLTLDADHRRVLEYLPNAILSVSESACASARTAIGSRAERRLKVLYPPFDLDEIGTIIEASPPLILALPSGAGPLIGCVGRHVPEKGFDRMIDALPLVQEAFPTAHLVLVGDGEARQSLEEKVADLGIGRSVTFTGRIPNGARLFAQVDVAVVPSRAEGLAGYSALEAIGLHCPVVASDIDAITELLAPSRGVTLVDASSRRELSAGVIDTLQKTEAQKRQATESAWNYVQEVLSTSTFMEAYRAEITAASLPYFGWIHPS